MNYAYIVATKILLIFFALCLCSISNSAVIWFDDGGVHDVNDIVTDPIQVWDNEALSKPTKVNFLSGSSSNYPIKVYMNSFINVFDGVFNTGLYTFEGHDNSTIDISGGTFSNDIGLYNNSNLIISGGEFFSSAISTLISMAGYSKGKISDGIIHGSVEITDNSQLYLWGGKIDGALIVTSDAQAFIVGGSIKQIMLIGKGVVAIYGTHFRIDGEPVNLGEITIDDFPHGQLTCKLYNEELLETEFSIYTIDSRIILTSDVPDTPTFCIALPSMDSNNDCKVDLQDFAEFASQWMDCNLEPQSACWE